MWVISHSRRKDGFNCLQYSTAKAAIIGFTRTLAIEGKKYGILANAIAPSAGTAMTSTVWPQEMVEAFKPDFIAPVVGFLTSKGASSSFPLYKVDRSQYLDLDNTSTTGALFEITGGWAAQTRWQRSGGYGFPHTRPYTPEDVISKWNVITDFGVSTLWDWLLSYLPLRVPLGDGRATNPSSTQEALQSIVANFENQNDESVKAKL